ncbi:poly-beta-1,6-N-acetyl-D-glucosamine N-deacetylase PgaB [Falsiroseomonas oryziterrae]|uniref:poly-beta-1,6-N-acetyl-D-glucosamine N-deacetylase PgaB n=1 Tax=Falsiroseomonas oryziterrae TaxID=2911368 RepID=UPI001F01F4CA|nr:poly-beta-1,6-N-acetyl-D-glucosamine N-deacetylase PgaB [Roseomonas sp. NPKOSM-4]
MRVLPLTRRALMAAPAGLLVLPGQGGAQPRGAGRFAALSYHEVGLDGRGPHYSISESQFVQHLSWMRANGWTAVSLDDLLAARDGRRALPEKAALLTFDDGYDDFHARVFPVLRAFGWPGIFALVTSWMEVPPGGTFAYGDVPTPRGALMSWAQAREMQASGLCEFAAHTHDLHRGVPANPQGNVQPALPTRIFDRATGSYETDAAWTRRVESDLARCVQIMRARLGRAPRSMVWPYGRTNGEAVAIARRLGMPVALTLDPELGRLDRLESIGRLLLMNDPNVPDLARRLRFEETGRERVLHVDLDHVYDADAAQQERNLDALVERVARLGPSAVYLQAFADPDGDGAAEALYFPNRHLPMRADLFNRVSWQLSSRAGVEVYAWMPVLAFPPRDPSEVVVRSDTGAAHPDWPRRLSPFDPRIRARIGEIYEDLAKHAPMAGLLFHDDAVLSDFEDASPAGRAALREAGLPADIAAIRADAALLARWTALKTRTLVDLTRELHMRALRWRVPLRTARNMFALPVLQPESEAWFAQSLPAFLAAYDRTAVMAMPLMEGARDPEAWLRRLHAAVAAHPGAMEKTVFELQATDWRSRPARPVPAATLRAQLRLLQRLGAWHMGWYPDDFLRNHPDAATVADVIGAASFPFRR